MAARYWWEDENSRPAPGIDSRSHEGIAYMNWCLRQKPAEPQPNAVERLLARAEEVVGLFEAMFGRLAGDANPLEAESLSKLVATYAFAGFFAPNEREDGPSQYREVLTDDRLRLMERWESDGAFHLAVERTIAENATKGKHHGRGLDLSPDAIVAYCDILSARESLLDGDQWVSLVQNVIQDSAAWGHHEGRIGELARAVRAAVQPLGGFAPKPAARHMTRSECRDGWEALKAPLRAAIDELRLYAKPPRPAEAAGTVVALPREPAAAEVSATITAPSDQGLPPDSRAARRKRSKPRGAARHLLVAKLNEHHRYDDGRSLNLEPIGNNAIASLVGIDKSTASDFFTKEFGSYDNYCRTCADPVALTAALRLLNGEVKPRDLYGRAPPGEGGRPDDA
jgi:hypothetical protein